MRTTARMLAVAALGGLLLVACSSDKGPAELAIKAAEQAINDAKPEAAKFVPDQLKAAEASLNTVKANFDKGEYKAALTGAQDLAPKAKELLTAAAAKKAELTKSWGELSGTLPGMVAAIKGKVDALAKTRKLPAGLTKEKLDAAKTGLAALTQTWNEATEAFKGGNLMAAVGKATEVKAKAAEIMATLGMPAAKS